MHHQYVNFYELEKKHREEDLARELEHQYWVNQVRPRKRKHLYIFWKAFIASLMNFFL